MRPPVAGHLREFSQLAYPAQVSTLLGLWYRVFPQVGMQGLTGDAWQTTDLAAQFGTSVHYPASANGITDPSLAVRVSCRLGAQAQAEETLC
jgi:hypothetical protein